MKWSLSCHLLVESRFWAHRCHNSPPKLVRPACSWWARLIRALAGANRRCCNFNAHNRRDREGAERVALKSWLGASGSGTRRVSRDLHFGAQTSVWSEIAARSHLIVAAVGSCRIARSGGYSHMVGPAVRTDSRIVRPRCRTLLRRRGGFGRGGASRATWRTDHRPKRQQLSKRMRSPPQALHPLLRPTSRLK